ncbi:MAG TPA: hypothetical protein DCY13_19260 [Verrucomicrobiales bacterium]|nr:hypothetical protein [Verrucomicrobiales bacterium]
MKEARAILAAGKVMSARWEPPRLSGEVMTGNGVIKTGLTIKDHIDVENQCPCKESRQWSRICGHALAVGLGVLHPDKIGSQRPARPDRTGPEGAAKSDRNEDSRTTVPTPLQLGISGHSLRLAVVLPPNLDQSLAVGSVTVFVEAAVNGGKFRPLATLDRSVAYSLAAGQQPLFELVLRLSGGELPTALKLSCAQLTELLAVLPPDSGTFGRKDPVVISEEPFPLPLSVSLLPSGEIQLAAQLPQPLPVIVPGSTTWALVGRKFSRVVVPGGSLALLQRPQTISREQVPYFLHEELPALAATGSLHADFAPEDFEITVRPPQFHLALEGGLAKLRARLSADYGLQVITLPHSDPRRCGENSTSASDRSLFDTAITRTGWLADPDAPRRYRLRDAAAERDALARLARAGFEGPTAEGWLQLTGQEAVLNFFARDYPRLKSDWQVTLGERPGWSLNKIRF